MTIWTGSSYVYFGVEGKVPEMLEGCRYDFDDDFHMTTHFLGKEPLDEITASTALSVVRLGASKISPFSMSIKGFKTYGLPDALARVAVFEAPPYVHLWRDAVAEALDAVGAKVSRNWPWSPHMTYAYGWDEDVVSVTEQRILDAKAIINIISLEMYDGTGKLVVPLTES